MIRILAFTAAAGLVSVAPSSAFADRFSDQTKVVRTEDGKLCIKTPAATGAIIDRIECHTQQEWARLGVTIGRR